MAINRSEALVFQCCSRTFLSLWSFPNPLRSDRWRELCDILIVCDPHVVVVSVKEVALKGTGEYNADWERWTREAVEKSVRQIYGAERELAGMSCVIRADGDDGLPLPAPSGRRVHRIAVALGGKDEVPIPSGNGGKGFVHVFGEEGFSTLIGELDTITDLTTYLDAVEELVEGGTQVLSMGEGQLLASYLLGGKRFPTGATMLVLDEDLWEGLTSRPEYLAKKDADRISYHWDSMIDWWIEDLRRREAAGEIEAMAYEPALRVLAREPRFARRILARDLASFLTGARSGQLVSRLVTSLSGVVYVLLARPQATTRQSRIDELKVRAFVARGLVKEARTIVGIATESESAGDTSPVDLLLYVKSEWTDEDEAEFVRVRESTKFFVNPRTTTTAEDEYPANAEKGSLCT